LDTDRRRTLQGFGRAHSRPSVCFFQPGLGWAICVRTVRNGPAVDFNRSVQTVGPGGAVGTVRINGDRPPKREQRNRCYARLKSRIPAALTGTPSPSGSLPWAD
jgi:hypothetical protein